ncbi:MAG: PilC/PilY family type IV pilus protein [Pseudomonadota bacterium]
MKMEIKHLWFVAALLFICLLLPLNTKHAAADEQELFTSGTTIQPNVLIILDNSQSMDEDFVGNSIGPWKTGSRLVEAKRALRTLVNSYANQMRIGLMTHNLPSVSAYHLHNAAYFVSYEPKSYCPSPPAACTDYCYNHGNWTARAACNTACQAQNAAFDVDYFDEIVRSQSNGGPFGPNTEQRMRYCNIVYPKTNRTPNPDTAQTNYIHYKLPGTYYSGSDQGYRFLYSTNYTADDNPGNDTYSLYTAKTGTSDDNTGYSGGAGSASFGATDEDIALGFRNWGRRMAWYHTSRVWFANSSPGGGRRHVACDNNGSNNNQRDSLLAKLDMKENDEAGYMSCSTGNTCSYIVGAGLTPTAGTFRSAINYFKGENDYRTGVSNTSPITDSCQKNFVIYISDGLPSVNETGGTGSATSLMPDVLTKIDALRALVKTLGTGSNTTDYTFNIKTYVLGMALTDAAKPHIDNMASHGGTAVDGYAYYADDVTAMINALNNIFSDIVNKSFSFSTASVSSSRLADENFLYEASFEPTGTDPFWKGYLKKWSIRADGGLDSVLWDAGNALSAKSAADRSIYTLINGTLTAFSTSNITYTHLNVADQTIANGVIGYVRGESAYNPDNWKLGDIFHANPITIGSPSPYFWDFLDSTNAFGEFRDNHPRSSYCVGGGTSCAGYGKRLVVVGANDGQFHAFKGSDGSEYWSFIPPNLLPKLRYLSHAVHPIPSPVPEHMFFVDGPVSVADVWLGTGAGDTKSSGDWKTLGVFSVGRNDRDYTTTDKSAVPQSTKYWSWNASCDGNIQETYNGADGHTYYYCGYYAFDFTGVTSTSPAFKWMLNINTTKYPTETAAAVWPFLGEPWSKMAMGRVKIGGNEKWVGFIGGGYNAAQCSDSTGDKRGKGIFVVDLSDGAVLWSFTRDDNSDMEYSIAAPLTIVDTDNDGFVDAAYVGDLKGNMWQFNFCKTGSTSTCGTANWTGTLLLDRIGGTDKYPLYNQATAAKDNEGNLWIYWATGDKADPTGNGPAQYVYGLKPLLCVNTSGTPTPCLRSDLDNITSDHQAYCGTTSQKKGWYINLAGQHEQVLADPVAFGNILYVTSFVPAYGSSDLCTKTGTAYLYAINIGSSSSTCTVGSGALPGGERRVAIGAGIASSPMISLKPGTALPPDLYVTTSGAGAQEASTVRVNFNPPTLSNRTNMLFWRDMRIQ